MISAADSLTWRPRIRREPDPRQVHLFATALAATPLLPLFP